MTSEKINLAIIESVLDSLSRANYDPNRAISRRARTGIFASFEDNLDAERGPAQILRLLKIRLPNGPQSLKQDIQHFVKKEVWDRSFHAARGGISLDRAAGRSPKRHIQEAREAIEALRAMGEKDIARWFEGNLKECIGVE